MLTTLETVAKCKACGEPRYITTTWVYGTSPVDDAERAMRIAEHQASVRRHETEHCAAGGPTVHDYNPVSR